MAYGAVTALRMGAAPGVVTSAGPDLDPRDVLRGIQLHTVPGRESTAFVNAYRDGRRTQRVTGVAAPVAASDVPILWRSAPSVLLAPLAGELSYDLARSFPDALVLASIQGWLRLWDDEGRISPAYWEGEDVLPHVDAAIVSTEDIGDPRLVNVWEEMVRVLIVTSGSQGATLHLDGSRHHIEPVPVREVDPTGAGDVFAAAYLIRYSETGDPLESARFAGCAAGLSVEGQGLAAIPHRAQVEERLGSSL